MIVLYANKNMVEICNRPSLTTRHSSEICLLSYRLGMNEKGPAIGEVIRYIDKNLDNSSTQ